MRIKGERMICKVSREQTLKTEFFKDCGWFGAGGWTTSSRLTVRHVQCPRRADENLPKWSWSPLSRSSPWSWSQASVSCDVGVHQANCGRPCRTLEKARRTNSKVCCCWEIVLPTLTTLLFLQPSNQAHKYLSEVLGAGGFVSKG